MIAVVYSPSGKDLYNGLGVNAIHISENGYIVLVSNMYTGLRKDIITGSTRKYQDFEEFHTRFMRWWKNEANNR